MKKHPKYQNLYADEEGNVYSTGPRGNSHKQCDPYRLTPFKKSNGYLSVGLCGKKLYVHRIILECYTGLSKLHCNHKNGLKSDNRLENLEWCTRTENMKHAYSQGLMTVPKFRKFSEEMVVKIGKLRFEGKSYREIETLTGVNNSWAYRLLKRLDF